MFKINIYCFTILSFVTDYLHAGCLRREVEGEALVVVYSVILAVAPAVPA